MTRQELIDVVAGKITDLPKRDVDAVVREMLSAMARALRRHDRIEIRDFGVFTPKYKEARPGRNPKTGEQVTIPAQWSVKFKPSERLQDKL